MYGRKDSEYFETERPAAANVRHAYNGYQRQMKDLRESMETIKMRELKPAQDAVKKIEQTLTKHQESYQAVQANAIDAGKAYEELTKVPINEVCSTEY